MKRKLISAVLSATVILASTCAFAQNIEVNKLKEGKNNIKVNEMVEFQLKENPTTGYTWHVSIDNKEIINTIEDTYKEDEHKEKMVGVGGIHTWNFKTLKKGNANIRFELYRAWEKDEVIESKQYEVNVIDESNKNIKVFYNDKEIKMDVKPIIENGTTLVPLRSLCEILGVDVKYNKDTNTVLGTKKDTCMKLKIGEKKALLNDKEINLEVASKILNERTLVPLRFLSESFGCKVNWDEDNQIINVNSN